jgi:hypothetical protein
MSNNETNIDQTTTQDQEKAQPLPVEHPIEDQAHEAEAPKQPISFKVPEELATEFMARHDDAQALESMQASFINEMKGRVLAARLEAKKTWVKVYEAAGLTRDEYDGTLDPDTGIVTFDPKVAEEEESGVGSIFKKLFGG